MNFLKFQVSRLMRTGLNEILNFLQGKQLYNNAQTNTIVTNQSLVLQSLTRSKSGYYTCVGHNQEGDGESNPVFLDVKCEYIHCSYFIFVIIIHYSYTRIQLLRSCNPQRIFIMLITIFIHIFMFWESTSSHGVT